MAGLDALRSRLADTLERDGDPLGCLHAFIREVDGAYLAAVHRGDLEAADELAGFVESLLARCTVALGPLAIEVYPHAADPIGRTVEAARAVVAGATEESAARFRAAATASYPFGPGDGCHAVDALGGHGATASGDATGVGFLLSTFGPDRADAVRDALRASLLDGLRAPRV